MGGEREKRERAIEGKGQKTGSMLRLAASRVPVRVWLPELLAAMAAAKRGVSLAPRRPARVTVVDEIDDLSPAPVVCYGSQPGTAAARSQQSR